MTVINQQTKTKADIINKLSSRLGLSKSDCKMLVDVHFEIISKFLEEGVSVKVTGLGKFSLLNKSGRIGRNPKTLEEAVITPRKVCSYRPSQKLINRIAKNFELFCDLLSNAGASR